MLRLTYINVYGLHDSTNQSAQYKLFVFSQNMTAETISSACSLFFEKENQIFRFLCYSTRENLFIHASITTVRLMLTRLG